MKLAEYLNEIVSFLQLTVKKANAKGLVLGISGGVDSAVVALLAKKAFPNNHLCLVMPCDSNSLDKQYAKQLTDQHQLTVVEVDLSATYKVLLQQMQITLSNITNEKQKLIILGNLKARLRMSTLYTFAQTNNYLVAGTDNADEWYTGYFTKYGDGGVDLLPIVNLLKQDVISAAKILQVPETIIARTPSAGLWLNQSDEEEMEFTYQQLDNYLLGKSANLSKEIITKIEKLHAISEHKRSPLPKPKPWIRD